MIEVRAEWVGRPELRRDAEGRVVLTGVPEEDQKVIQGVIQAAVAAEREACLADIAAVGKRGEGVLVPLDRAALWMSERIRARGG